MEPTQPNSGQSGAAAAAVLSPDPKTRELLLRKAAGEKLSAGEYGTLGAFARWLKKPFGAGGNASQPGAASPGGSAPMASGATAQTPGGGVAPVEVDPDIARGITSAVLGRGNVAASNWIEREARATANAIRLDDAERDKVLARFRLAANLKADDQKLIADLSPYVCRELNVNPAQLAMVAVGGILILHGFNLWQCVQELKDLRRSRSEPKEEETQDASPKEAALGAANNEGVSKTSVPDPKPLTLPGMKPVSIVQPG